MLTEAPKPPTSAAAAAAAAAAAKSSGSTGFDLINHAIRMGSGRGTPIAPPRSSIEDDPSSSSDLLLKARLQQQGILSAPSPIGLSHAAAVQAAAEAASSRGIVAALQRRHRQPLDAVPVSVAAGMRLHQQLRGVYPSGLTTAPAPPPSGSSAPAPPPPAVAAVTTESQDEQNARQLNPNAFQFPWKLHDMLDRSGNENYEDVVSWVEDGTAFRVHMPDAFVKTVMPRFFKQTKYKSFQRQLNLYGFTRLHNGLNKGGYKHKYFRKGQRTLCQLILRCPIRDSTSAATTALAAEEAAGAAAEAVAVAAVAEAEAALAESSKTAAPPPAMLPHAVSNVSMTSKPSSNSLNNSHHSQATAAAILAAHHHQQQQRMEALSSSFHIMEKARQEQHLQQIQAQQFEVQRLQQLNKLHHHQREISSLTSSYVPGMPLAGTDHSAYPSSLRQQQHPGAPSPHDLAARKAPASSAAVAAAAAAIAAEPPHHVLDTSNSSSMLSEPPTEAASLVTPNSPNKLSDKDKLSILHKEFQFPWKLYEMLERADAEEFSHLVSWMPGTTCFKVHDADNFVKTVMSRFFKQTKYKSFQRQLNLYGFIRVDIGPNKGGYRHPSFIKGRKDLLPLINRMRIKGTGRPRSDRSNSTAAITDTDSSTADSNKSIPNTEANFPSKSTSGIDVILEAIKAKERKESTVTDPTSAAQPADAVPSSGNAVSDVPDSSSDSNSTIPSTIDIRMKDADPKTANGLSWRQHPAESFSDWTIETVEQDVTDPRIIKSTLYHVHRRVLAVGPKKSDYFANIFKLNGAANKTQLRLTKREAAVFPMALDYIYADVDFDLDTDKAYALYSLGERLENDSIINTVTKFYTKWCMTKENIVGFIKLGDSFLNKTLLDAALLKCSQDIWSMDVLMAAKIDPIALLRILVMLARVRDTSEYNSHKLSQMVAICVSSATQATLSLEVFRSLTDTLVLPSIEPFAAVKLLATENTLLSGFQGAPTLPVDPSLHERCIWSIRKNWDDIRKRLKESSELADTMRSISSWVLFDLLMETTSKETSKSEYVPYSGSRTITNSVKSEAP